MANEKTKSDVLHWLQANTGAAELIALTALTYGRIDEETGYVDPDRDLVCSDLLDMIDSRAEDYGYYDFLEREDLQPDTSAEWVLDHGFARDQTGSVYRIAHVLDRNGERLVRFHPLEENAPVLTIPAADVPESWEGRNRLLIRTLEGTPYVMSMCRLVSAGEEADDQE